MKRLKNTITILIANFTIFCCAQENKNNNQDLLDNRLEYANMEKIEKILVNQIKSGAAEDFGSFLDYSEEDLNALIILEDSMLKSNGFKIMEEVEFNHKIKKIFNRIIDNSSQKEYLKIDTDNICDKNLVFYPFSAEYKNIYISKTYKFITFFHPLPQIIDYKKLYPELSKYEEIPFTIETMEGEIDITRWKDIPDLDQQRKRNIQTLVARNMYLFNDNKAQFKWLILNDQYFMESLVKTFGYTQDTELLKWVIERTKFDKNNPQDYGKLFWIKQCDGTLKLHTNTFKVLQTLYQPNDNSENRFILDNIQAYLEYLGNLEDIKTENISEADKVKIMANLTYFSEQYKYNKNFNSNSKMMGRLRFFLNDEDIEILKKNNYFNLPKFKEWWDNVDYDEYIVDGEYNGEWGTVNHPLSPAEWRKKHPKK